MDLTVEMTPSGKVPWRDVSAKVEPLNPDVFHRHKPTAHYAVLRDGTLVGRYSIWTRATPALDGRPVSVFGHFAAADAMAGVALLQHAAEVSRDHGIATVVGPMDGNTWRSYRLVTERGDAPPFFLEPNNPDECPAYFETAGFEPLAQYFSGLNEDLAVSDPRVPGALDRLKSDGVKLRSIDLTRLEDELRPIHALSLDAFKDNFLYTPISEKEFLSMYAPLREHLRPELILLAEQGSQLIGYVFGLPDLAQARRGEMIDTAIAKTIAVYGGRTGRGLGSVLLDQFQQAARQSGYRRVIHALMHEGNRSRQMVSKFGRPIRRYTLFAKGAAE